METKQQPNNLIAVISYLTLIGLLIAIVMNQNEKNEFASFHIKQSLGITLVSLVLYFTGVIPIIGWIISLIGSIFLLILWIIGLINAITGKQKPVPVLGEKFLEWFSDLNL
jgi:uncharacterized membrane protein